MNRGFLRTLLVAALLLPLAAVRAAESVPVHRLFPAPERPLPDFNRSKVRKRLPKSIPIHKVKAFILIDLTSRTVLAEKASNEPLPIASVTKLMTLYTAFEIMNRHPQITLATPVEITRHCIAVDPTRSGLPVGTRLTLKMVFTGAAVRSFNDFAELIAERFGRGDPRNFVTAMNLQAARLGMKHTCFINPHGLTRHAQKPGEPEAYNYASCTDLARLIEQLYAYPELLRFTATKDWKFRGKEYHNTNPLLGKFPGADGLKTGYTAAAGRCLAFSAKRGKRRLIGVALGFNTVADRNRFVTALLEWGFAQKL